MKKANQKMRRRNSSFAQRPSKRYDGVILQIRKAGALQQIMTVFTKQEGCIRVLVQKRRQSSQGFGLLMAWGEITFDAVEQQEFFTLREYECRSNSAMTSLTWEGYVYSQIFAEMVMYLMPVHQTDWEVYRLLQIYGRAIEIKDIRIVTIIAGWQLIVYSGFEPDVDSVCLFRYGMRGGIPLYYLGDKPQEAARKESIPLPVRRLWKQILTYRWGQEETLHMNVRGLQLLEYLLYSYVEQCSDKPLKGVSLLEIKNDL